MRARTTCDTSMVPLHQKLTEVCASDSSSVKFCSSSVASELEPAPMLAPVFSLERPQSWRRWGAR
eukprot:5087501-Prymnesium_polylepis.2